MSDVYLGDLWGHWRLEQVSFSLFQVQLRILSFSCFCKGARLLICYPNLSFGLPQEIRSVVLVEQNKTEILQVQGRIYTEATKAAVAAEVGTALGTKRGAHALLLNMPPSTKQGAVFMQPSSCPMHHSSPCCNDLRQLTPECTRSALHIQ